MTHSVILKIPETVSLSFLILTKKIERLENDANQAAKEFDNANTSYLNAIKTQCNKALEQIKSNEIKIAKFAAMISYQEKKIFNKKQVL